MKNAKSPREANLEIENARLRERIAELEATQRDWRELLPVYDGQGYMIGVKPRDSRRSITCVRVVVRPGWGDSAGLFAFTRPGRPRDAGRFCNSRRPHRLRR
jgi:hypothetical protein